MTWAVTTSSRILPEASRSARNWRPSWRRAAVVLSDLGLLTASSLTRSNRVDLR
jgi:hypothetical protein